MERYRDQVSFGLGYCYRQRLGIRVDNARCPIGEHILRHLGFLAFGNEQQLFYYRELRGKSSPDN